MRIAAALPLYPPNSRVGAWLATHGLLAGMAARGHQIDVATYLDRDGYAYILDGVRVHPRCPFDQIAGDADVIVSHLGDNQQAAKWAKAAGKPLVRMVHGIPERHHRLDGADLAVFNSESLRSVVGWSGRSIVAHPISEITPVAPGPLVTLVNLSSSKGGRLFWNLAHTTPSVQFLGVRGGYGRQVSDKGKNVTVIDPTIDMAGDVYSRTRILLMPSLHETWGMVGMEAMSCGIPVIAHPTPGLLESLGSAGVFVDRDDVEGWREAIFHLSREREWSAASRAARERAAAFNPEAQIATFASAVESLVPVAA